MNTPSNPIVATASGHKAQVIKDGIKTQFEQDLENYLAETFCHILPPQKLEAENGDA